MYLKFWCDLYTSTRSNGKTWVDGPLWRKRGLNVHTCTVGPSNMLQIDLVYTNRVEIDIHFALGLGEKKRKNRVFSNSTETLGSLHSQALLILTKSSKSKNHVVHEHKFKDLLSNVVKIVQKGECWTWNQRSSGSILTGVTFCYWNILFSHSTASDANILIIAKFV